MAAPAPARRISLVGEYVFATFILISVLQTANFLLAAGYMPPPYFYNANDTFMDWYNTAYWSNNIGTYDIWRSIYPPVSFLFLRLLSIHACYQGSGWIFYRNCDWLGRVTLLCFFCVNFVLIFLAYAKDKSRTAVPRAIATAIGLPMVFALERGNLIIPCFTFFVLAHSGLLRSARLRWISSALTINFKPYLVLTILPNLIRRRWRAFEGVAIAGIFIYLFSFAIFGFGTPADLLSNILNFNVKKINDYVSQSFYGASYSSIVGVLRTAFPLIMTAIGSRSVDLLNLIFPLSIRLGQLGVALTFVGAALRPGTVPLRRLTALSVMVVMSSYEVGGYAEVFFLFLVFYERWENLGCTIALLCSYLLCISVDFPIAHVAHEIFDSYLTNRTVGMDVGVYLGELVRPGLILLIEYGLVAASLASVVRDWHASRVRGEMGGPVEAVA